MRVLIADHLYKGHYAVYFGLLVPRLCDLVDDVVVGSTSGMPDSQECRRFLAPHEGRFKLDVGMSLPSWAPPLVPSRVSRLKRQWEYYQGLRALVDRVRPDYLIAPTADLVTMGMIPDRLVGRRGWGRRVHAEAGFHWGHGAGTSSRRERLWDARLRLCHRVSPWDALHYVNVLVYEDVKRRGGSLGRRARLMADPTHATLRMGKREARKRLGLPEDGRYIGLATHLDSRKRVDKLLAAFRRGAVREDDRLLLAGQLDGGFARLVEREYSDLTRSGRLFLINRFLEDEEIEVCNNALDVVCIPRVHFGGLSETLILGAGAGRPVLADDFGWSRMIIRRLGLGWTCDVQDPEAFARALGRALEESGEYRETEAARRFFRFHSPENFVEGWLAGVREVAGLPAVAPPASWEWVMEAVPEERRSLV